MREKSEIFILKFATEIIRHVYRQELINWISVEMNRQTFMEGKCREVASWLAYLRSEWILISIMAMITKLTQATEQNTISNRILKWNFSWIVWKTCFTGSFFPLCLQNIVSIEFDFFCFLNGAKRSRYFAMSGFFCSKKKRTFTSWRILQK